MKQRRMRLLREKHGVSMAELSRHCAVSSQRLSQIELETQTNTVHLRRLVEGAFARLIKSRRRKLSALESDIQKHGQSLLDYADDEEGQT